MVVLLVIALSLSLCVGVVGATSHGVVLQQSSPDADNDSQTRHEHPDEANEEGDLSAMREHLASQLVSRLGQSSVEISQGEYDQAREAVGDDYDAELARYVEIAEQTGDEETAREFEEAAENQREFANAAERYERTYAEYQRAVEAGDEERARELARELERHSEDIEESGAALEENYANLTDATSEDLSEERQAVEGEREEIRTQQVEIRELEFVGTEIRIERATEAISFTEPLELEGQLVTETGEPIADREVTFSIGEQTVTTTTDADGTFSLMYRPTALGLETTSLEIEYEPASASEYARSSTTVPVAVSQTDPTVTIEQAPTTAAFGDEATVAGTVRVEEVEIGGGVSDVPVVVSIGGERVAQTRTATNGSFTATGTVPGTVPTGERTITVTLPLEEQAIAAAETTRPATIEETDTRLAMTATRSADDDESDDGMAADALVASGRLATADGRSIANQPIRLLVDGTAVATVETNDAGEYESTLEAPSTTDGTAEVTAVYDGAGTNFADARATDTVTGLPMARSLVAALQRYGPLMILGGLGLLLLAWDLRRRDRTTPADPLPDDFKGGSTTDAERGSTPFISASTLLELARERLGDGETDRAIELAYAAVRRHFARTAVPGWTHWEFYTEAAPHLDDAERDTLLSIVEQFERAVFAPGAISETAAGAVVSSAERLISTAPGELDADDRDRSSTPTAD